MDTLRLAQWWAWIHGTVFDDTNSNGKQDPGEKGIPHQLLTVRERSNSLYEHGTNLAETDENGHYELRARLPARPVARARAVLRRLQDHRHHVAGAAGEDSRPPSSARRSTSTSCRGSARAPRSTGARSPTRRPRTAASSASSPTARPGTSSTRTRPSSRTGSPASPGLTHAHLPRRPRRERRRRPQPRTARCSVEGQAADGTGTPTDIGPTYTTEQWDRPVDCQSFDADGDRISYPFMADYAAFTAGLPLSITARPPRLRRGDRRRHEDRRDPGRRRDRLGRDAERQLGVRRSLHRSLAPGR